MGVKSKSQAKNQSSQLSNSSHSNIPFEKRGLIFESRNGYNSLKNIDRNASQLVDAVKSGSLDIKEFFGRFEKVKVKETYPDAAENLEELFENITRLYISNDREYFETELDFTAHFHSKIDVEFYDD